MIPMDRLIVYNAIVTDDGGEKSIVECIIRDVYLYSSKIDEEKNEPTIDKLIRKERILVLVPINGIGITINISSTYTSVEYIVKKVEEAVNKLNNNQGLEAFFNNNPTAVKMFKEDFLKKYIDKYTDKVIVDEKK